MLSDQGLASLRMAATLAHGVPALRVRVRHAGRLLVDVAPTGTDIPVGTMRAATPCGFRTAVAHAWQARQAGERLALLDLGHGVSPAIEIGVPPCGMSFGGNIFRVPMPERHLYVFATTLPVDVCREEAHERLGELTPPDGVWGVGLRADEATDVCLVYAERSCPVPAAPEVEDELVEMLQSFLAGLAVRQLLDDMLDPSRQR